MGSQHGLTAPGDSATADLAEVYESDARFLRGLCYRLTGDVAASDDIVQDTFVRAIEHGPSLRDGTLRPWLVRVATNLGRDHLRSRRRQKYVGPWLPTPVPTEDGASPPSHEPIVDGTLGTEGRYDLLESASFAFLLALEALTPKQRAVLLLRDVFDYTVAETADALDLGEPDVKTSHHRARHAMAAYDRSRCVPTRVRQEKTRAALAALGAAVTTGDARAAEALLASSVHALSDGGGEFFAARVPLLGPERVARFYTKIATRRVPGLVVDVQMLNGLPALVVEAPTGHPGEAPRFVTRLDVDAGDRIVAVHSVLATGKLVAVPFRSRMGAGSRLATVMARRAAP
jgi:RNA polymerase sigma factor (sigma-70 family)